MLAIVIPYYKLTFFTETLSSLAQQTDKRFKVYIGDDASPENPSTLIDKFYGKFEFVYHRFDENLGSISLTQQWDRCIALTQDEKWIMILGDDDTLGKNSVEEFYNNLHEINNEQISVLHFATQIIDKEGKSISNVFKHPRIEKSTDFIIRKISNLTRSSMSEYIYKKDKTLEKGFKNLPLAWYSDDLAILEFSDFKNIYSINNAIVFIRFSSLSISGSTNDFQDFRKKRNSRFEFYFYLLSKKRTEFFKNQNELLFSKLEKCFIEEKKQINYFIRISYLYIRLFMFLRFFKFFRKCLSKVFRKK